MAFEVASVKPNKSTNTSNYIGCYFPGSRIDLIPKGMCIARNMSLRSVVGEAYGVDFVLRADYVVGGAAWVASDRFDIDGKAENPLATGNRTQSNEFICGARRDFPHVISSQQWRRPPPIH
ncbi:MAG: TIGR03435 family protein [Acidobacteria bacterium]|nr:TIGR03435 family protein [Acidobacteriota bacterium]